MNSYYEVLGISADADGPVIKAAYRRLAFEWHPDRNSSENAADRFYQITTAYEALIDPIRREAYDALQLAKLQQARMQAKAKARQSEPEPEPVPKRKSTTKANAEDLVKLTGLLTRGRFPEAERLARKMIGQNVSHPVPYAVLGDVAKMRGDLPFAAEMYAYAVQLDGRNLIYQRKQDEVTARLSQGARGLNTIRPAEQDDNAPMLITSVIVLIACVVVVMSNEAPMAAEFPMIGTWTGTLAATLAICGLALGTCLSFGGMVDRFNTLLGGFGEDTMSPGVLVALLALVNFWLAALVHCIVGVSRRRFDLTTSRFVGGAALITLLLSGASAAQGKIDYSQTLFWGGNVVYAGLLLGWLASDALQEEAGRLK